MSDLSPQIQEAMTILGQDPLPSDARQRLEQLEKQAPADQRGLFDQLWEAFYAAGGTDL